MPAYSLPPLCLQEGLSQPPAALHHMLLLPLVLLDLAVHLLHLWLLKEGWMDGWRGQCDTKFMSWN